VLDGLDVLLALNDIIGTRKELVRWALGIRAVDAEQLILQIHQVPFDDSNVCTTNKPHLMTALLAMFKLDRVH
jgi:hypothetical protein